MSTFQCQHLNIYQLPIRVDILYKLSRVFVTTLYYGKISPKTRRSQRDLNPGTLGYKTMTLGNTPWRSATVTS